MALKSALYAWLSQLNQLTSTEAGKPGLLGMRESPDLHAHAAPARIDPACQRYCAFSSGEKPLDVSLGQRGTFIRGTVAFGVYGKISEANNVEAIVDVLTAAFKALEKGGRIPVRKARGAYDTDVPHLNVRRVALGTKEDDVLPAGDGSDQVWIVTTLDVEIDFVDPVEPLA